VGDGVCEADRLEVSEGVVERERVIVIVCVLVAAELVDVCDGDPVCVSVCVGEGVCEAVRLEVSEGVAERERVIVVVCVPVASVGEAVPEGVLELVRLT
jgi:hypothetical protein